MQCSVVVVVVVDPARRVVEIDGADGVAGIVEIDAIVWDPVVDVSVEAALLGTGLLALTS
jgi:hypothetical protein